MEKIILLFLFLSITSSCNTTLGSRDTKFKYHSKEARVASQVILNKDGTFQYQYWGGLIESSSRGKWQAQSKDSILIRSDRKYKHNYMEVRALGTRKYKDKIELSFINQEGNKLDSGIKVKADDRKEVHELNDEGKILLNDGMIKELTLSYFIDYFTWEFERSLQSDLEIRLVPDDLGKTYFENQVWIKKGRKLIDPDGRVYKWKNG